MYREIMPHRPDWKNRLLELGMTYYEFEQCIYWDESVCYRFHPDEIDLIEDATNELHAMCLQAVQYVIDHNLFHLFRIPENYIPYIRKSWERRDPYVYGRFDLSFDGINPPKMLEYNADTPTMLPETAVMQWFWLNDVIAAGRVPQDADQFNSVHESLLASWRGVASYLAARGPLYFTTSFYKQDGRITNLEDYQNIQYMRDVCSQAGVTTDIIDIGDIGWNGQNFTDLDERHIDALYKLYPWEFIARENFADPIIAADMAMIEPVWKMLLSNKAILPILWRMFPNHPNLLPASFDVADMQGAYVKKPLLGREGANVTIVNGEASVATSGLYGEEGFVYQVFHSAPEFNGHFPIIGSWVVTQPVDGVGLVGRSSGMGIREDATPITGNNSRFVPHYIVEV